MNNSYYAVIPAPILYSNTLKANSKLLYGIISSLANQRGYCYASNNYMADMFGFDKATITRLIKDLERHNFVNVEIIREGKQVVERRIYLLGVVQNDQGGGAERSVGVVQNDQSNIYSNNNIKDNKTIPYQLIYETYTETLPELSKVKFLKDRHPMIRELWNFHPDHKDLNWWKDYFSHIRDSDFLMGRSELNGKHKNWKCNFDFLLNIKNFKKVVEGKYHE